MKNPPNAYETTGIAFWDDEHISKSMLSAHLALDSDGASRNHSFIKKSVEWINSFSTSGRRLLDLGCGPGIYAELFYDKGYSVTGIDFSERSIEYARKSASLTGKSIEYVYQDYFTINFQNEFDIATLIYCDFGVLSPDKRKTLLDKIYTALKPGGRFFVDVFSARQYEEFTDNITVTFEETGFWRATPYLCLKRDKRYEGNLFLEQYIVITEEKQETYNLWNHAFSQPELSNDLLQAGFISVEYYSDIAGNRFDQNSATICAVCEKS